MEPRQNPFDFLRQVFEKPDWYMRSPGTWKRYVVDHFDFLLSFHSGYLVLSKSEILRFQAKKDKFLEIREELQSKLLSGIEASKQNQFQDFVSMILSFNEKITEYLNELFDDWKNTFSRDGWSNDHSRGFAEHILGKRIYQEKQQEIQVLFENFSLGIQEFSSVWQAQALFEETSRDLIRLRQTM